MGLECGIIQECKSRIFHTKVVIIRNPRSCGVFVSQFIHYARVCLKYSKLLKQGYSLPKLQIAFRNIYGRHTNLVHKFYTSVSHMLKDLFTNCEI